MWETTSFYGSHTDKETMIEWILDEFDRAAAVLPYAKDLKDSELGRPNKKRLLGRLVLGLRCTTSVGTRLFFGRRGDDCRFS